MTIRAALEIALAAIAPPLTTAWQNTDFTPPVDGSAYQRVDLMPAEPENPEMSSGYQENGILQIGLCYPLGEGPANAEARAALIRSTFPKGRTLTGGGTTVQILRTPEIGQGKPDDKCFFIPVRIRYFANFF